MVHSPSELLSFLHREIIAKIDKDVKIKCKRYCHHDGEQLGFHENIHIETNRLSKKKDVLAFFILQETKILICLFDKNHTQDNVKCHIQNEES